MGDCYLNSKKWALRHPAKAWQFYRGNKLPLQKKMLFSTLEWARFDTKTLEQFEIFWQEILRMEQSGFQQGNSHGNHISSTFAKWLYLLIRATKPEVMVETGVAHGYSSSIILQAMHQNKQGTLYSIDLPGHDTNANYNLQADAIGHVVPNDLRSRWQLIRGDVREELPPLLDRLQQIDCFFHDSDHSYENMSFEFQLADKHLRNGGFLISDDVYKNKAYAEFMDEKKYPSAYFTKGACCRKTFGKT
ncbi:MAG: class I SAM-dependent methyltransferase [Bacteroidetes bacterium]|nr:MAG: class I SAM-dependent methyltransferase [Bacteroidota bacterium]